MNIVLYKFLDIYLKVFNKILQIIQDCFQDLNLNTSWCLFISLIEIIEKGTINKHMVLKTC